MPSEALRLKWDDIDFERNRMIVRKGKTKKREMPVLPPLRQYLLDCFDPEQTHVINRHRSHCNWGTEVKRFIVKAGLEPWHRCFHNLRASLETDLTHQFPIHVVTAWFGNSEKVASDHYLTVRDSDFEAAIGWGQQWGQQLHEKHRSDSQAVDAEAHKQAETLNSPSGGEISSTPAGIRTPTVGSEDQSAIHYTTGAGKEDQSALWQLRFSSSLVLRKMYTEFVCCGNLPNGGCG